MAEKPALLRGSIERTIIMSDRYIFFSDLDDTLLTTKKEVSPKTYEALKNFTDKGNIFVICTGRGLDSALKVQKK